MPSLGPLPSNIVQADRQIRPLAICACYALILIGTKQRPVCAAPQDCQSLGQCARNSAIRPKDMLCSMLTQCSGKADGHTCCIPAARQWVHNITSCTTIYHRFRISGAGTAVYTELGVARHLTGRVVRCANCSHATRRTNHVFARISPLNHI
jgi:hypothetical protein